MTWNVTEEAKGALRLHDDIETTRAIPGGFRGIFNRSSLTGEPVGRGEASPPRCSHHPLEFRAVSRGEGESRSPSSAGKRVFGLRADRALGDSHGAR